ncbi:phospholipid scramblase 1-like [Oscarella lobularis]|uniref:phospholipid scramblase 1-like n=1 Tax=Oscarella lobularis TaxID=121494 RepID=UPI003313EBC6
MMAATQQQPTAVQWMPAPEAGPPDCPPGLEYLTQIDQLLVHQQVELLEMITGWETANKYDVKNSMGQRVYFAAEQNSCFQLQCCGASREFNLTIVDNAQREVIHLYRPLRCTSCCFPCCLQELVVEAPAGQPVGYVKQRWTLWIPEFDICSADGNVVLKIVGPCCTWSCGSDVEFKIFTPDKQTEVGKISKQWSGLVKEMFTDADNFGITFPLDLDVKMKAVMLGACFLIDFMFFEQSGDNNRNRHY